VPELSHDELAREVSALEWYHTLELAPEVVTPGWMDTRAVVDAIPFPSTLAGKRCLDVATLNGYWAFEMERRGAAEVVAIDVAEASEWDWPASSSQETIAAIGGRHARNAGFEIARRALGSSVQRLERSVYDLAEAEVGMFDLVYIGSLLVHLRDPVRALERVRAVCKGMLIVVDGVDPFYSLMFRRQPIAALDGRGRPWWWYPNAAALARMIEAAGFEVTMTPRRINIPPGAGRPLRRFDPARLRTREGRYNLFVAWRGDPHAIVVARPQELSAG
jgi:tRNA (mo5U34)-methyltransferase